MKRVPVGIAISADQITAVLLNSSGVPNTRHFTSDNTPEEKRDLIQALLTELTADDPRPADLHVGVLPDAAQLRVLQMPQLRPSELRAVLQRDAHRLFIVPSDFTIGAEQFRLARRGSLVTVAAVVAEDVLAPLRAACGESCRIASVVPAHSVWAAAAARKHKGKRISLVVQLGGVRHGLLTANGRVLAQRRSRHSDAREELTHADCEELEGDAVEVAARFARSAQGPRIETEAEYVASERRRRDKAASFAILAAGLLVLAGTLEMANLRHEAAAMERLRQKHTAKVAAADAKLKQLVDLRRELSAFDSIAASAAIPSEIIADLAEFLPFEAHVTRLRLWSDSIEAEIRSTNASNTLRSLRRSVNFGRSTAHGTIRRLLDADSTHSEAITVRAAAR